MLSTSGSCELIHENQDRHSQLIHWVTSKDIRATHALSTAHNSPVQRHQFANPSAISRFINEFRAAQFEGVLVFHRLWAQSGTSSAALSVQLVKKEVQGGVTALGRGTTGLAPLLS